MRSKQRLSTEEIQNLFKGDCEEVMITVEVNGKIFMRTTYDTYDEVTFGEMIQPTAKMIWDKFMDIKYGEESSEDDYTDQ